MEWNNFSPSARSRKMLENLDSNRKRWNVVETGEGVGGLEEHKGATNSYLDLEHDGEEEDDDDDVKPTGTEFFTDSFSSLAFQNRKAKSSSSFLSQKVKVKVTPREDKENHDPEELNGSKNHLKESLIPSHLSSPSELRRLSLPTSQQPPSSLPIAQVVDKRRASLPLSRILEHDHPPTSFSHLEALLEVTPPHSTTTPCSIHFQSPSQPHTHDRVPLITSEATDCESCKQASSDLGKLFFDARPGNLDRSRSFNFSGKSSHPQRHSSQQQKQYSSQQQIIQQQQQIIQQQQQQIIQQQQQQNFSQQQKQQPSSLLFPPSRPFLNIADPLCRRASCPNPAPPGE